MQFSLFMFSTALLVFLAASARTRIVTANFLAFYDGTGLFLLQIQCMFLLFVEDLIPLRQLIQPVSFCVNHVLVQFFFVKFQADNGILFHFLNRVCLYQALIDTIQESGHLHNA